MKRLCLAALALLGLLAVAGPAHAVILGLYPFEGNFDDASANGRNPSTISNVTLAAGLQGQAANFAGNTSSFLNLPINVDVGAEPVITWGAWVRPDTLGTTNREIFSTDNGGFDRVLTIDKRIGGSGSNPLQYSAFRGSPGVLRSSATTLAAVGQPRFVAAVYDQGAGTVKLYVEEPTLNGRAGGLVLDSAATNVGASNGFIRMGMHAGGANEPFQGLIDNAFVFRGELDAGQLETIRQGGAAAVRQTAALQTNRAFYQSKIQAEPSLVSFYPFDGDTASVTDVKGGNNGTLAGTAQVASSSPFLSGGDHLSLDGLGHVDLGTISDFQFADGSGTVEAWIRPDWTASPGYNPAWFTVRDGGPVRYSLHANANLGQLMTWSGALTTANGSLINGWHHVAVVFDSGQTDYYLDGGFIGSGSQGLGTLGLNAHIGSSTGSGAERWIGGIDELAIYADALTATAIAGHYNAFFTIPEPSTLVLAGLGIVGLAGMASRRRRGRRGRRNS